MASAKRSQCKLPRASCNFYALPRSFCIGANVDAGCAPSRERLLKFGRQVHSSARSRPINRTISSLRSDGMRILPCRSARKTASAASCSPRFCTTLECRRRSRDHLGSIPSMSATARLRPFRSSITARRRLPAAIAIVAASPSSSEGLPPIKRRRDQIHIGHTTIDTLPSAARL